jgi:hypothetical protein
MPKVELHVHLEGSIALPTLLELARTQPDSMLSRSEEGLLELYRFRDFAHFLEVYLLICRHLRSAEEFALITRELGASLAAHPLPRLIEEGLVVTLNSDDRRCSGPASARSTWRSRRPLASARPVCGIWPATPPAPPSCHRPRRRRSSPRSTACRSPGRSSRRVLGVGVIATQHRAARRRQQMVSAGLPARRPPTAATAQPAEPVRHASTSVIACAVLWNSTARIPSRLAATTLTSRSSRKTTSLGRTPSRWQVIS